MKKNLLLSAVLLFHFTGIFATMLEKNDTTFVYNNKIIHIRDSADQVNVSVKKAGENGSEPYKTIFEGIYCDERSFERWSVMEDLNIQIPFITSKKVRQKHRLEMQSHWAGLGWGRISITDGRNINNISGVNLDQNRCYEFNYNMFEHITPIFFRLIGLTSGLGLSSRYYYLDNNTFLQETNDMVTLNNGAANSSYSYSRLHNVYLTVPIMLELQFFKARKGKPYLAAGVVGGVRLLTSYKTKFTNAGGSTQKTNQAGMNVPPLTLDYVAQAGIGKISIYAKYSPFGVFEKGKGPDMQHTSIGFMLDL
jgi:hypothetical protein